MPGTRQKLTAAFAWGAAAFAAGVVQDLMGALAGV